MTAADPFCAFALHLFFSFPVSRVIVRHRFRTSPFFFGELPLPTRLSATLMPPHKHPSRFPSCRFSRNCHIAAWAATHPDPILVLRGIGLSMILVIPVSTAWRPIAFLRSTYFLPSCCFHAYSLFFLHFFRLPVISLSSNGGWTSKASRTECSCSSFEARCPAQGAGSCTFKAWTVPYHATRVAR